MWARWFCRGRCPKSVSQSTQTLSWGFGRAGGGGMFEEVVLLVSDIDIIFDSVNSPIQKCSVKGFVMGDG